MGIKNFHFHARAVDAFETNVPLLKCLDETEVDMVFVDMNCVFFSLLQSTVGDILLQHDLNVKKKDANIDNTQLEQAVLAFLDQVLKLCYALVSDKRQVCIVLDGVRPFPLKNATHVKRQSLANHHLNIASRLSARKGDQSKAIHRHAIAHTRFTRDVKEIIVEAFKKRSDIQPLSSPSSSATSAQITYFFSLAEADAQVVYLANEWPGKAAIISQDSDLFMYGGAMNTMRITKVDWADPELSSKVTTKTKVLDALKLRKTNEADFGLAQMRLAVIGSLAGNDYVPNPPKKAFKSIYAMVQDDKYNAYTKANNLMASLLDNIPRVYEYDRPRYHQALLQFCSPYVLKSSGDDNTRTVYRAITIDVDHTVLDKMYGYTAGKPSLPPAKAEQKMEQGSRYKTIMTNSVPKSMTKEEKLDPITVSSRPKKRAQGTASRDINKPDDPSTIKKRQYKDLSKDLPFGENGALIKIHPKSRAISTWSAGLYSSVLSSASDRHRDNEDLAVAQARFITGSMRQEVTQANTLRTTALQIATIAIHLIHTGNFTIETKQYLYKNFFQSSRGGEIRVRLSSFQWEGLEQASTHQSSVSAAQKTWTWILTSATHYDSTSKRKLNDLPTAPYESTCPQLDRNALVDNPNRFIAYPDDTSIKPLVALMTPNPPLRNILLAARHHWWQGYQGNIENAPDFPSSTGIHIMLETLARELDSAFRANVIHNFVPLSIAYYSDVLAEKASVPTGWPMDHDFPAWILTQVQNKSAVTHESISKQYPNVDAKVAGSIVKFVTRLKGTQKDMNADDVRNRLKSMSVAPQTWPQHSSLGAYVFLQIFHLPVDDTNSLLSDMAPVMDVAKQIDHYNKRDDDSDDGGVEQQPITMEGFDQFVQQQRDTIHRLCGMTLDTSTGTSPSGATLDVYDGLGLKRPRGANAGVVVPSKPIMAHVLLQIMMHWIYTKPDFSSLSFSAAPRTKSSDVFIQFTDRYLEKMIHGFKRVSGNDEEIAQSVYDDYTRFKSSGHQAASSRSASSTSTASSSSSTSSIADDSESLSESAVETTLEKTGAIGFLMDITRMGEEVSGKLIVRNRAYHRKSMKLIEGSSENVYTPTPSIKTNGVRLSQGYTNWTQGARKDHNVKLQEVRSYIMKNDAKDVKTVIGVDLGEVCPAASFSIPLQQSSDRDGIQFVVRRQEVYGNNTKNANWLQQQKDKKGIFEIEQDMAAEGNKQAGTLDQYQGYLRATQAHDHDERMRSFYNSISTKRVAWDTSKSIRSAVDRTTHMLLQSATDKGKVLIGIGEDAVTAARKARKGAAAPMDTPMRNAIIRQSTARGIDVVRVDEYCTSQICPQCLLKGKKVTTEYLKRVINNSTVYRVKRCPDCGKYYHRDGMAAHNQALILETMIKHKQRPEPFIRPSRSTQPQKRKRPSRKKKTFDPGGGSSSTSSQQPKPDTGGSSSAKKIKLYVSDQQ